MTRRTLSIRLFQVVAAVLVGLFGLGLVYAPLGLWTGTILGAWFVGTQKPARGFAFLAIWFLVAHLFSHGYAAARPPLEFAGWLALAALASALPFLLFRLTAERLPGNLFPWALPFWGVAIQTGARIGLPAGISQLISLAPAPLAGALGGAGAMTFLVYEVAAVAVWLWNFEFRRDKVAAGAVLAALASLFVVGFGRGHLHGPPVFAGLDRADFGLASLCLAGGLGLSGWALARPAFRPRRWSDRAAVIDVLRSPNSGLALTAVSDGGGEFLVSAAGESFPVRRGIPVFSAAEDFTASNQKYNRLYERIGGFYDDSQRLAFRLLGIERAGLFLSYLRMLEIKPGDLVLETSVGTGLNFKYLPRGIRLLGIDLSAEMLVNCQANLRRWALDADLFQGNAERLPFADDQVDVVYHVGGINFFNDRARAIREMIRVAKPGSRILIADETEKHVQAAFERTPVAAGYFKNRSNPVAAPIDLVPPEMQDVQCQLLSAGNFYVLTFRKPGAGQTRAGRV